MLVIMFEKKAFTIFCAIIIFISFILSIKLTVNRYNYELKNAGIELAMSYSDIVNISLHSQLSIKETLNSFKKEGKVTSIAIQEDTLGDLEKNGKITILKGSEIINMHRVGHINRYILNNLYKQVRIKPNFFYLIIDEKEDFERIFNFLSAEFGKNKLKKIGRYNILEVFDQEKTFLDIGIGISSKKINLIKSLDFNAIYQLKNSNRVNPELIKLKLDSITNVDPSYFKNSVLIFKGSSVLGYPNELSFFKKKLQDTQLSLGLVEFSHQSGYETLKKEVFSNIKKIHTIPPSEMLALTIPSAIDRYTRAAKERGINILYINPFHSSSTQTILEYNLNFIKKLNSKLIKKGITYATTQQLPMEQYRPASKIEIFFIGLSIVSALLFCLFNFIKFSIKKCLLTYMFFIIVFFSSYHFGYNFFINNSLAFIASILFPSLGIISQFPVNSKPKNLINSILASIVYTLKLVGICLVGAFFIIALLSDARYILGVFNFIGVKISYILPIIIVGLYFYLNPNRILSVKFVFKRLFNSPIKTSGLVAISLMIFFITLLILRSGNYFSMPQFIFEKQFREFLETVFFVRPRTKEFLIGYPFLILAFLLVDKKISRLWIWFFNMIGTVALISIINSFCHVHTPIDISVYRTLLGVLLGFVVTAIYGSIFLTTRLIINQLK